MTRRATRTLPSSIVLMICGLAVASVAGASPCHAQVPTIAIGGTAGDSFGLDWKFIDPEFQRNAYEASIGWTIRDADAWEFRWMYQRTAYEVKRSDGGRLQIYAGAGFRVKLEDDTRYGLRMSAGVNFLLPDPDRELTPEIFLEAAPTFDVSPRNLWSVGFAGGVRWRL